MNATDIWYGHEYAVCLTTKPKNVKFVPGCVRLKVMRVYKQREDGKQRDSTYVSGIRLTDTGETLYNGEMKSFRAYNVVDFWDDYEDAKQFYEIQQRKLMDDAEAARLERNAMYEQRERDRIALRDKVEVENQTLRDLLSLRGFDNVKLHGNDVLLSREDVKRWLNVS